MLNNFEDRLASGLISPKSQPVVDSVSVQPVAEEKPEVVALIEPVVEKLPTHEIQSFDPIRKYALWKFGPIFLKNSVTFSHSPNFRKRLC